jgi:hypothetical protein
MMVKESTSWGTTSAMRSFANATSRMSTRIK